MEIIWIVKQDSKNTISGMFSAKYQPPKRRGVISPKFYFRIGNLGVEKRDPPKAAEEKTQCSNPPTAPGPCLEITKGVLNQRCMFFKSHFFFEFQSHFEFQHVYRVHGLKNPGRRIRHPLTPP